MPPDSELSRLVATTRAASPASPSVSLSALPVVIVAEASVATAEGYVEALEEKEGQILVRLLLDHGGVGECLLPAESVSWHELQEGEVVSVRLDPTLAVDA